MKIASILLTIIMLGTNYFVLKIFFEGQKYGDLASIGVEIYQIAYWFGGIILAVFVIAWDGIRSMSIYDKIVFILTTPIGYLITSLSILI
ncbi:MAG: hypothetical protein IT221_10020 [Fluviicola sp.]|nr:hypothetical protein [Fluviicola sp.]